MEHVPKTLDGFLQKCKTKEDQKPTHTKIGDAALGIYGGSYFIPKDKMEDFYKLYHKHVIKRGDDNYLTEVQFDEEGPILVDIDERYSNKVSERQHTDEHIIDLINLYVEKICEMSEFDGDLNIPVYVMEKDDINTSKKDYVKDGIHIVFGVSAPHAAKRILRSMVLQDIGDIFEDLPLTNSYEELVDFGIAKGITNWQLYGSKKPGNDSYKLKKLYNVVITKEGDDSPDIDFEETIINNKTNYSEILPIMGARNYDADKLEFKPEFVKKIDDMKKNSKIKKKPNISVVNANFNSLVDCQAMFPYISNEKQCRGIIEFILGYAKDNDNYNIQYAHELTMVLDNNYYEPYADWIKTALVLKNISQLLYPTFLLFSSKSPKFTWGLNDCFKFWNETKTNGSLSIGSLKYWAKKCDIEQVKIIDTHNVDYYLRKTLSGKTEYDIAMLVYAIYEGIYKCYNIKSNMWYEYGGGKWSEIDQGTTLRHALSHRICRLYHSKVQECLNNASEITDGADKKEGNMEAARLSEMGLLLKKTTWKQNIMKECRDVFFDKQFINKLDTNPDLLCFKNGVLDMDLKIFRPGEPNDYLSLSTNTYYIKNDPNNPEHVRLRKEITEFMEQLFPNKNLNKYMWEHLASTLRGKNKNQTFNIYTGSGRNGKSKLVALMGMVLGDYKGSVPLTLITRERTSIGSVSPEIAQLKGLRYAVMQEPSKATKLNEGPMKELVGEDPIQGRALFKDTITFIPQFKLVVCTNHLFDITSNDDGTWRRIRVCDFVSKFVEDPSEDPNDYEFKVDKDIDKKFEEWVPMFTTMLVEKLFETDGLVEDCPEVMAASQKYKAQQDHFAGFIKERITKHEGGVIKKKNVKEEFEEWFSELYSGKIPSGKELYQYLTKVLGEPKKKGWVGWTLCHDMIDDSEIKPNII